MSDEQQGGLAAVFAHPDDESFGCAGAMALARDAGRPVRLLVATRGEAGTADGVPDEDLVLTREEELRGAARAIGLDEVTMLEGYADGGVAGRRTSVRSSSSRSAVVMMPLKKSRAGTRRAP